MRRQGELAALESFKKSKHKDLNDGWVGLVLSDSIKFLARGYFQRICT